MSAAHRPWPPLPAQACLGVIAPAGPPKGASLAQVEPLVTRLGFRAKLFPGCAGPAHLGHLAASDAQRLADLHAAFADPQVDAVLALRGGYGCARLLPDIDTALLQRHPKPLIGFSDLTALHALRLGLDLPGWHAPMPASNWGDGPSAWADALALAVQLRAGLPAGEVLAPALGASSVHRPGRARGRLAGGNLAVLASLLGTPFMPDLRGCLLFIEDVAEDAYKVDRLLGQLRLAGVLSQVSGVLVGSFTEADDPAEVLRDYLAPLAVPVLSGWPSGHCSPHVALPLGADMVLEVDPASRGGRLRHP